MGAEETTARVSSGTSLGTFRRSIMDLSRRRKPTHQFIFMGEELDP